jgi:hypothetical protein
MGQNLAIAQSKTILQFVPTLVRFSKYTDEYFLRINMYKWFSELTVQIWEYTGIDSDSDTEILSSIELKLLVTRARSQGRGKIKLK